MTPGPASSSPRLIGLLMLALFPAVAAAADLVNLKLDWPTLEYKCSNSTIATFKVVGPAIVNFRLEVAPYRTAGRIIRSTGNFVELNDRGESITDWALGLNVGTELLASRTTQNGVEVRNPVEDGPPLVTESTWNFFEARTYWYAVRMSPPCDTTSNLSHVSQPGQRAKLVVRYGEGSGASDRARAMLAGRWLVTLNQHPGTLEMIRKGDGWIARIDGVDMSQASFDAATGRLTFVRPTSEGDQRYQGTVTAGSISGTFDQGGSGSYTWNASRPGATPAGHTARRGTPIGATAQGVAPASPEPATGTSVQTPVRRFGTAGTERWKVRLDPGPYFSTFELKIAADGTVDGVSHWTCCSGPVNRITGRITPDGEVELTRHLEGAHTGMSHVWKGRYDAERKTLHGTWSSGQYMHGQGPWTAEVETLEQPGSERPAPTAGPARAGSPTPSIREESQPVPVISCSSTGQVCAPAHTSSFEGAGELWISYTAGPRHCSDVAVRIRIDELPEQQTGFVSAGQTTEPLRFMIRSGGTHRLVVTGVGRAGGCNTGAMLGWTGALTLKWASSER